MRRFLLTVATAATALTATACGDITGVNGDLDGIYELETIGGQTLPVTIDEGFESVTYIAGDLEIEDNGRFFDTLVFRVDGGSLQSQQISGTWDREGDGIRFTPDDEEFRPYFMERTSSSRLVFTDNEGLRWVYQR